MKLYPNITTFFITWFFSIFVIFYFGFMSFPSSGRFVRDFWQNLSNWDGGHYLAIAQFGYSEDFQYAFFPLYPMLIRAVNYVFDNYLFSALLISLVSVYLLIQLLYRLIILDFDRKISSKVIFNLLIFPTSFFFVTAYSESLFLLLTVATFYFTRKNKLFLATITASLAGATRLVGLATIFAFLIEVLVLWRIRKKNWYVFLSLIGFLIYSWYLYNQTGDPFYFITAQNHWLRNLSVPGLGFLETFKNISTPQFLEKNFNALVDLAFAIFGLGLILRSFRFLPASYSIYSLISILLPLFTPTLFSMPRFLLPIFPIFIILSLVKNEKILLFYQMLSILLLSAFAILFINGYWVS